MKRFLPILLLAGVLGLVVFVVLKARFGKKDAEGESAEEGGASASKGKTGPRDFAKSKAGLIRTTDVEKGAQLDPSAPETPLGEYIAVRDKVLAKWREAKVDISWDAVPMRQALDDLAARYGLAATLDAEAEGVTQTVAVEQMPALAALELMTNSAALAWVVTASGDLVIMPQEKLTAFAPPAWYDLKELWAARESVLDDRNAGVVREPELAKKLRDTAIVARSIPAGDLQAFLRFLSQVSDVNYVMRPTDTPPQLPALAPLEGESLDSFLRRALEPAAYTFKVTRDSVIVLSREQEEAEKKEMSAREDERRGRLEAEKEFWKKPVNVGGENLTVRDIAEGLARDLGVPLVVDPRSARRAARYSFKAVEGRPAQEVVDILKRGCPVEVTFRDGKIWILAPEDLHEGAGG
ncbi:MAG: hypothetical protein IT452_03710 [Planctomycetia bacterium]|nr:hypothetical protein [Planctomycetia bacterium]